MNNQSYSTQKLMPRRAWLAQAGATALVAMAGASAAPALAASALKKGCTGGDPNTVTKLGGHWYFTWGTGGRNSTAAEFVPMIKGRRDLADEHAFEEVRKLTGITHLLGYNEPERSDQGNLPLADALKNWPRLVKLAEAKNLKLGSPVTSSDVGGMTYFHAFMEQAKRQKLRIDFIAMHWYRSRNPAEFAGFLDDLARRYRLPIWLTEFNGWSGAEPENFNFLKGALRYLERSRHIERYAYFEPGAGKPLSLFKADGSLSRMGEVYRDAGA